MRRAQRVLFSQQLPDGSWDERSNVGPSSTTCVLVALSHAGLLPPDDLREGGRWLMAQQRPDGGFLPYPYATKSDLGTTAQAWAALHLAPSDEARRAARRARAFVEANGGVEAVLGGIERGDTSAFYLGLAGLLEPKRLPRPPLAWVLSQRLVDAVAKRFHYGIVMGAISTSLVSQRLRRERRGPLDMFTHRRALELLGRYQNADGSWNSNTVQTAIMIPAMLGAGLDRDDPRVRRAASWLLSRRVEDRHGVWFDVFASDVWATAFNLRALIASGIAPTDRRVVEALEWLLSRQLTLAQPRPNNRKPGAILTGGWPFQTGNETMADTDDTGVVLSAFAAALEPGPNGETLPASLATRIRASVGRARTWLADMQNPDGGWAAFVWDVPGERPPGTLFGKPVVVPMNDLFALISLWRHPPPELGNPSTEDLTARVLDGLASQGANTNYPEVDRAVRFLRSHQTAFGAWWSRWVCNYLASTSFVLMALAQAREDLDEVYVKEAIEWMLSHQNADGGFGESSLSYRDPTKAGVGLSTAPMTALVTLALVATGRGDRPEVRRAVDYLLAMQRPDGTWPNGDFLLTNIPPDSFYFYSGNARHMPLWALGAYSTRHAREALAPAEHHGRWSSAMLAPFRQKMDPLADDIVAEIYRTGDPDAVTGLLRKILENDDPIPAALPDEAEAYFRDTAELPPWADPTSIARAQELFATHGVYLTYAFFASSLPQAYASAHGAEVLVQTGAMLDRVRQRIFETAQFLFDVLDEDSFAPEGRGIRAAQRVRLMHGAIRHLILTRDGSPWDGDGLGQPINQEDLIGTLMTFSSITFEVLQRFGIEVGDEDGDAWVHHWTVVGHFLGIERELMPTSLADAKQLTESIRQRHWAPSPQGQQLTAALVDMMQEFFTRDQPLLDGMMPSLIRFLAGDQCADILGVEPSDWTVHLIHALSDVTDTLDTNHGEKVVQRGLGRVAVGAMKWITDIERGGKQASFRIPASLRRSVLPND